MEKTKIDLLAICDYASISQDNKLSIMGIFEQIFISDTPSTHPQMFIVGIIKGEANKAENITLKIQTPSGVEAIPVQTIPINIGPNGKSNIIASVGNLPLTETGFYKIIISAGKTKMGEKEFGVFKSPDALNLKKSSEKYKN